MGGITKRQGARLTSGGASDRENTTEWNIGSYSGLECTKRSASVEGSVAPGSGSNTVDVVECVFKGGQVCNLNKQWGPAYEFMSAHKRVEKWHTALHLMSQLRRLVLVAVLYAQKTQNAAVTSSEKVELVPKPQVCTWH